MSPLYAPSKTKTLSESSNIYSIPSATNSYSVVVSHAHLKLRWKIISFHKQTLSYIIKIADLHNTCEISTRVCLANAMAAPRRAQAHTTLMDFFYRTWLLTNKRQWQYKLCMENIVKTPWLSFLCYDQWWRHHLFHSIVRTLSINVLTPVQLLHSNSQKESITYRHLKIYGQLYKISILVKFGIIFNQVKNAPVKHMVTQCPRDSHQINSE